MTNSATLSIVKQSARTLGVPLPAVITALVDRGIEIVAAADRIGSDNHLRGLTEAVLDAVSAGRDYHEDEPVRRLHLDSALVTANIGYLARSRMDAEIVYALVESADGILADWAEHLERHTDALEVAAGNLPTHDLDDTVTITRAGPEAISQWGAALEALRMWTAAVQGFSALALAGRVSMPDQLLILAPADTGAFERARATAIKENSLQVDAWMLARNGVRLSLPTLGEYTERVAEHQEQIEGAASRFEQAQRGNSMRRISPELQKARLAEIAARNP